MKLSYTSTSAFLAVRCKRSTSTQLQPADHQTTQRGCDPDRMAQPTSRVVRYGSQISAILKGKLRDCQIEALVSLVKWFQNPDTTDKTAIVVMPTGSGKSGVIASFPYWFGEAVSNGELRDVINLDQPILVIAPGLDILKQLKHCLKQEVGKPCFLIKVEAIKDTYKECREILYLVKVTENTSDVPNLRYCQEDIVLTNAQKWEATPTDTEVSGATWRDLDDDLFSLVVVDEAHHLPATQWEQIIKKFHPHAKVIFFTATPYRADGKKIDDIVPKYTYHLSDREATDLRIIRGVQFKELPYCEDDNRQASYAKKLEYRPYIERVIEEVIECIKQKLQKAPLPEGVPHCAMLICRDIAEAKEVMRLCREQDPGLRVECVHSDMEKRNLNKIMKEIDKKLIRIIVIVQKLLEGFDCPCVSVAGILTRIRSAPKFAQFIGRARRVIHGEADNVVADVITHKYFEQDKLYRKYIDGHLIPVNDDDVDSN